MEMKNYVEKHDKLVRYLDMTIESATPEYAKVTMPITENHKNGMGMAHGGAHLCPGRCGPLALPPMRARITAW